MESTPDPSANDYLFGVAITGGGHAWAVGMQWTDGNHVQPLIEHDNGGTWRVVPASGAGGVLMAVTAVPHSREAWAVGATDEGTLTEHWDGSSWTIVPSPSPAGFSSSLRAGWARSADDVWAVGSWSDYSSVVHTLAEHWDGSAWSIVPTPDPEPGGSLFDAVSGTSGDDIWAVGNTLVGGTNVVTEHWDGSAWTNVPAQIPAYARLTSIDMVSSTTGWAAGTQQWDERTLIARLVGGVWRAVATPNIGRGDNVLSGVAASSPSEAWAVGTRPGEHVRKPLLLHWNGKTWATSPSPPVAGGMGQFLAVAATTRTGAAWAVGVQAEGESLAETNCRA